MKLSGKISDRINGELKGKVEINPERPGHQIKGKLPAHDGHRMTGRGKN